LIKGFQKGGTVIKKDFKKELKDFYTAPTKDVSEVDVPAFDFVMVDGSGDPNTSEEFKEAIQMLYKFSYTLKFKVKKSDKAIDYGVMPLEGLWWAEDMNDYMTGNRNTWKWTLMIMQPFIDTSVFEDVKVEIGKKAKLPALSRLRLEKYHEGPSVQIMHVGPYAAEAENIKKLHDHIRESGHELSGKHHEIYLSDARRVDPAKMKTLLRQPYA
jgi:hypothetical protein